MNYEPKMLINNQNKVVEFTVGGDADTVNTRYIFQPGEKRILDGWDAYMGLQNGLSVYGDVVARPATEGFEKLSWEQLRKLTDSKGNKVYRLGMSREALIKALKDGQ